MPKKASPKKALRPEVFYYLSEELPRLENYVTSEGTVSHNVLYYQQLSIARYKVSFYGNNFLSNYQ